MSKESKYIPLREATKYCNYSQSYLSLRARQGKLKAKKIKRNWYTTKEWLKDYLENIAEEGKKKELKIIPPDNLPIESEENKLLQPVVGSYHYISSFSLVIVFLFFISLLIFSVYGLSSNYLRNKTKEVFVATAFITTEDVQASTFEVFKDYKDWLVDGVKGHLTKVRSGEYFSIAKNKITGYFSEEEKIEEIVEEDKREKKEEAKPEESYQEEGIVILSSEEEERKEDIKKSFSDEVEVEPEDNISGIIIPIFEKGKGQEYFYVMVPVDKEK
jgi:hypothetical protein